MDPLAEEGRAELPGTGAILAPTVRAFVALEIPAEVRAVVAALMGRLARLPGAELARIRWTPPENLHLTLKFLGRVETAQLRSLREALVQAARGHGPFPLAVTGAGAFPDPRGPHVLWLGIDDPDGKLAALAAEVERLLAPLGFATENRAFSPHLTLGRVGTPRRGAPIAETLARLASGLHEEMREDGLILFRSDTLPGGARHTPIYRIPFGAAAGDGYS